MADADSKPAAPAAAAAAAAPAAKGNAEGEDYSLKNPDTVTKYNAAGDIANRALRTVVDAAVAGAKILDLCTLGDKTITEASANIFRKTKDGVKIERGVAFPTCISVNECVCHFSPLASDKEVVLKDGDLVKVELGVHIDGLPTMVATSFVVGATKEAPVTGRRADVLLAGHSAAEAALRLIRPGNKSTDVMQAVDKILSSYNVKAVQGISTYSAKRNTLEGDKHFTQALSEGAKREAVVEFTEGDVYNVEILVSSGEGHTRQLEARTTIFRRNPDVTYMLKLKTSRALFNDLVAKSGVFALSLRSLEDEARARMGIVECVNHGLVTPYDVYFEKEGEVVAQFKYAVMLLPSGPTKATTPLFDPATAQSAHTITDASLLSLLAQSSKKKSSKKKKKTAGKADDTSASAGNADDDDDKDAE